MSEEKAYPDGDYFYVTGCMPKCKFTIFTRRDRRRMIAMCGQLYSLHSILEDGVGKIEPIAKERK